MGVPLPSLRKDHMQSDETRLAPTGDGPRPGKATHRRNLQQLGTIKNTVKA